MDSKNKYCFATIKSYTSVEQSRKLAEILPIDSADMAWYPSYAKEEYSIRMLNGTYPLDIIGEDHDEIPAWSLAALLNVLPDKTCVYKKTYKDGRIKYQGIAGEIKELILKDNPVDACVTIIERLHELKML